MKINKSGDLKTPENIKVNEATRADEAVRVADCFGPETYKTPSHFYVDEKSKPTFLLKAEASAKTTQAATDEMWYEILPPETVWYTHEESETSHSAKVNLGSEERSFGKVYAKSFNGTATAVSIRENLAYNGYELSITGDTLTFTKK